MAVYDPPQPLWKRNVVGILDFLLASLGFSLLLVVLGLARFIAGPPPGTPEGIYVPGTINLQAGPFLVLLALIIAYFVVLGRLGGTVFQRLFGMKRGEPPAWDPPQPTWKRILVGILDFLLAFIAFGLLSGRISAEIIGTAEDRAVRLGIDLSSAGSTLLLLILIFAYFIVLGRTGGTVFQRLFRMKRAKATPSQPVSTA
jgi:RDD family